MTTSRDDPARGDEAVTPVASVSDQVTGPLRVAGQTTADAAGGAPAALTVGRLLRGRYNVLRFVARGGVGEVYEAEDLAEGRRVAVKVLRTHLLGDARVLERFTRESEFARRVEHRNVCRIFEVEHDPDSGLHFLTMELLQGETLAQRIARGGRMSATEALPIALGMAAGLQAAHEAGILHRDFKSQNVVLVPEPSGGGVRPVITDFGLARPVAAEPGLVTLTVTGAVLGTPAYMAPEQVQGHDVTPATDVYSLGVVLYEMVTGSWPFAGDTPLSQVVRRLNEAAPAPRQRAPELDARWDRVILRCLEREPADRFATPAEVAAALLGRHAPGPRELRRRRRLALRALGALALAAGVGLAAHRWATRPASHPVLDASQLTTNAGLDAFPSFSPDGKWLAYASDRTGSFELVVRSVDGTTPELSLTKDGRQNVQPAWSPDGRSIVFHSRDRGGLWIMPAAGGAARQLTAFGSRPSFSPDGESVVFQSDALGDVSAASFADTTLFVVATSGGEPTALTQTGVPPGGHSSPKVSPDGRRVVFAASELGTSGVWTVGRDGADPVALVEGAFRTYDPVWAPDGRHVYYSAVSQNQSHGLYEVAVSPDGRPAGEPRPVDRVGLATYRHLAISPDGRRLVYSGMALRSNLHAVELDGEGRPRAESPPPLTAETTRNSFPVFSPDGERVAFIKFRPGQNSDVWVADADGSRAAPVTSDPAIDYLPSWLPDGRIAFHSNRGGTWSLWAVDPGSGREQRLPGLGPEAEYPRVSPDGRRVLYHRTVGRATNVWVAALDGSAPRQLTSEADFAGFGTWAPDGRHVAVEVRLDTDHQVGIVSVDGGPVRLLTTRRGEHWVHGFSPDGDKVAFAALRDGTWNLFWVSRSTGREEQLTRFQRLASYVRYPAWSPRGDRIAYELAETTGNLWIADGLR